MAACSGSIVHPMGLRTSRARLGAALCASALLHFTLGSRLPGGAPGEPLRSSPPPAVLAARLVPMPVPAGVEATLPPERTEAGAAADPVQQPMQRALTRAPAPPVSPESAEKPRGAAQPPAPDLTYYAARQLDVYPALVSPLRNLDNAFGLGSSARALLLVLIDDAGMVNEVSVVEATPAAFSEDDAKRAFAEARFTPAYRGGRAVRSRVLVEVSFGAK